MITLSQSAPTPPLWLTPWIWTGLYLAHGAFCLVSATITTGLMMHAVFLTAVAALTLLTFLAPLHFRTSIAAGGAMHDIARRASILPTFYLCWRYLVETGVVERYFG